MSTYSVTELQGLDGKKFAEAWFDRPGAIGASWGWVVRTLASRFECSEDEIDCEEPADDDESGDDYATVGGKRVARIVHRFPQGAEIAHRFLAAAE